MTINCTECGHRLYLHARQKSGAYRCRSFGCGCEIASVEEPNPRERGDDDGIEYADPRDEQEVS